MGNSPLVQLTRLIYVIGCLLELRQAFWCGKQLATKTKYRSSFVRVLSTEVPVNAATDVPDFNIRPSLTDKARTIAHVCTSGTLCTLDETGNNQPFGSYVDYMLDENGWPVLLLSDQSLHSKNILKNPSVSLFCQLPRAASQESASLSRVTVMGSVEPVPAEELPVLKLAFTLIHQYAEQIVDSPRFGFFRIKPGKIYFTGGFGVQSTWVDVDNYEKARPDVMATEVPTVLSRVNTDKQLELFLICKHVLNVKPDLVRIQAIDRLGIDLRVKQGENTDEYRVGFRYQVNSAEDAKSEMIKLFQEVWEREQGYFFTDSLPPYTKYASDLLRNDRK